MSLDGATSIIILSLIMTANSAMCMGNDASTKKGLWPSAKHQSLRCVVDISVLQWWALDAGAVLLRRISRGDGEARNQPPVSHLTLILGSRILVGVCGCRESRPGGQTWEDFGDSGEIFLDFCLCILRDILRDSTPAAVGKVKTTKTRRNAL